MFCRAMSRSLIQMRGVTSASTLAVNRVCVSESCSSRAIRERSSAAAVRRLVH